MTIKQVQALGFDQSTKDGRYVRVRCSQCAAMTINGTPCHEARCPNESRRRRGRGSFCG